MLTRYSPDAKGRAVRKALIYTRKEHGIRKELIDPEAVRIITHLRNNGFEGYIVGGAVRDMMIGKTPKDFDIVTNAEPAKIKRIFRNSRIIGKRFRLVHIFFGSKIYEVSTFRSLLEGTIGNSFGTMDEDVQRRDFTLNALYYDPVREQVIDYVGGVKDIHARKLIPVIPLKVIFRDDPVRMLRAIKYSVSTDCKIPFLVGRAIRKNSGLLAPVSPSRLTEEIIKILHCGNADGIVQTALKYDLFMYLQPGAASLIDSKGPFARKYAESMTELDALVSSGEEVRLARKLIYLIRDFVDIIADWDGIPGEVYNDVYFECRRFIMPMNPPRVELEFAVRMCLKEGGLHIKLPRLRDKHTDGRIRDDAHPVIATEKADRENDEMRHEEIAHEGRSGRRRRRRRPRNPISASS